MATLTTSAAPLHHPFHRNPFRVLGLAGEVTWPEIVRAAERLRELESWGTFATAWDLPWLGTVRREPADVEAALTRLADPPQRLRDRMFWFHERDAETAVAYLTPASIRDALEGWAATVLPVAKHDAAVVALVAALSLDEGLNDPGLWKRMLQEWSAAITNDEYWLALMRIEMEGGFDQPASLGEVRELRETALRQVAEIVLGRAREAVIEGVPQRAVRAVEALRDELPAGIYDEMCGELARHLGVAPAGFAERPQPAPPPSKASEPVSRPGFVGADREAPREAPPPRRTMARMAGDTVLEVPYVEPDPPSNPMDGPARADGPARQEDRPARVDDPTRQEDQPTRVDDPTQQEDRPAQEEEEIAPIPPDPTPSDTPPVELSEPAVRSPASANVVPDDDDAPDSRVPREAMSAHLSRLRSRTKPGAPPGERPTAADVPADRQGSPTAADPPFEPPAAWPAPQRAPTPPTPRRERALRPALLVALAVTLAAAVLFLGPWLRPDSDAASFPRPTDSALASLVERIDGTDDALAQIVLQRAENTEERAFSRRSMGDYRGLIDDYDWRIAQGLRHDPQAYRRVLRYYDTAHARYRAAVAASRVLADRYDHLIRHWNRLIDQYNDRVRESTPWAGAEARAP